MSEAERFPDERFWSALGWQTCHVLFSDRHEVRWGRYCVDDLKPYRRVEPGAEYVEGSAWLFEELPGGGQGHVEFEMQVTLGPKAKEAFRTRTSLEELVPDAERDDWLSLDLKRKKLAIRLD